jgi:hypothetical protein
MVESRKSTKNTTRQKLIDCVRPGELLLHDRCWMHGKTCFRFCRPRHGRHPIASNEFLFLVRLTNWDDPLLRSVRLHPFLPTPFIHPADQARGITVETSLFPDRDAKVVRAPRCKRLLQGPYAQARQTNFQASLSLRATRFNSQASGLAKEGSKDIPSMSW